MHDVVFIYLANIVLIYFKSALCTPQALDMIKEISLLVWTNFLLQKEKIQLAHLFLNSDYAIHEHSPTLPTT